MGALFGVMRFLPFLLAIFGVFFVVMRMRGHSFSNKSIGVGRLINDVAAEDKIEKRLNSVAISAGVLFVAGLIVLGVILFNADYPTVLVSIGFILGCLVMALGIVGVVFSRILSLPDRKGFFSGIFGIAIALDFVLLMVFSLIVYLIS